MKSVMAIGAHPDDIEFGCAGTLIRHHQAGDTIVYVCMTDTESQDGTTGEIIRSADQVRSETVAAAKEIGCSTIKFLPFKDLHVPFSFQSVSMLESVIKEFKVDTIYTHWAGDANQDHIATFKSTMAAARYVPNVFCYEQIPISRMTDNQMEINYYVDVDKQFEKKIRAALCHESQIKKYSKIGLDVSENLTTLAKFRAIQAKCKYAEAFKILKMVMH